MYLHSSPLSQLQPAAETAAMADKNAEFRALNNNAAAAALYPPAAAASALYPPVTPPSVLYPPAVAPAVAPALAPALALFPPSASPSMAAALYPPPAAGAGEGFGYDSAPPPYYSLANPAFVAATGGFQVGAKLEAVDGIGSTEAGKQLICVATIKAAAADRVLISFDGVGRLKRASFLPCVRACVCACVRACVCACARVRAARDTGGSPQCFGEPHGSNGVLHGYCILITWCYD